MSDVMPDLSLSAMQFFNSSSIHDALTVLAISVMKIRGDSSWFQAQQVFIPKDHRRRQVAGSRRRQMFIHRGSKRQGNGL
jgi:hypothetical protein